MCSYNAVRYFIHTPFNAKLESYTIFWSCNWLYIVIPTRELCTLLPHKNCPSLLRVWFLLFFICSYQHLNISHYISASSTARRTKVDELPKPEDLDSIRAILGKYSLSIEAFLIKYLKLPSTQCRRRVVIAWNSLSLIHVMCRNAGQTFHAVLLLAGRKKVMGTWQNKTCCIVIVVKLPKMFNFTWTLLLYLYWCCRKQWQWDLSNLSESFS